MRVPLGAAAGTLLRAMQLMVSLNRAGATSAGIRQWCSKGLCCSALLLLKLLLLSHC
jgi:hypothetical protein